MHNADFFIRYKLHHVIFWLLLLGLWYNLRYEDYTTPALAFKVTLIKVLDLVVMVYFTNNLLIPFLLYKKRYVAFNIVFVLMIVVSSVIKMKLVGDLLNEPSFFSFQGNIKTRIYDNVIPHFFLVIAGAAFKLMYDQLQLQNKVAEMAKEKAEAELNFLKSQINPHFLFNSLNSVYFLIDKNNTDARMALHKFSEMLRYQLYEANGNKIPIEKEITFLHDYVNLQQMRKDENYKIRFVCSANVKGFSIESLLLIPFVENAIKHISHNQDGDNYVWINMDFDKGALYFTVENLKEPFSGSTEKPGGIGLKNVKRRLELLYPGKHDLKISEEAEKFKVELMLKP